MGRSDAPWPAWLEHVAEELARMLPPGRAAAFRADLRLAVRPGIDLEAVRAAFLRRLCMRVAARLPCGPGAREAVGRAVQCLTSPPPPDAALAAALRGVYDAVCFVDTPQEGEALQAVAFALNALRAGVAPAASVNLCVGAVVWSTGVRSPWWCFSAAEAQHQHEDLISLIQEETQ